ncbi:MAG: hypothetical protein OXK80_03970 [Bdellovibrionales bacterium]|nr:hypothetical protein [Bdellovibrionales bacterium]
MKFFVLIVFFFALSCSSPDQQNSEIPSLEGVDLDAMIAGSREAGHPRQVSIAKSEDERDRKINPLREEEIYLSRDKRRAQRRLRGFASGSKRSTPAVYTICRRFDGCQRFCADWLNQNTNCNQWPVSKVVEEWSYMLDSLTAEQLFENAQWIALRQDVSIFLREADHEQSVINKIIFRLSRETCSLNKDIYHSMNLEKVNLYLVHPEGQEHGLKKITDHEHSNINIRVFEGAINKCLDNKQFSLSELMLVHQNALGFQLIHQEIADSCGHNEECVQLAYCKIDSEQVWSHLEQVKSSDDFNIEVQAEKCSYEDFNSLPFVQL